MAKELVFVSLFVEDAVATANDYVTKLTMHKVLSHHVEEDDNASTCIVLAGSERPPWVALFSGRGQQSFAARVLTERVPGAHQLVYFTDTYDDDLIWLRRRGAGYESLVLLDGARTLRRASSTIPELGIIIDLVERPSIDLDEQDWRRSLVEAVIRASQTDAVQVRIEGERRGGVARSDDELPTMHLPAGETLAQWVARLVGGPWTRECMAVANGRLRTELEAVARHLHAAGADAVTKLDRSEALLADAGLGARVGRSSGGRFELAYSPIFLSAQDADCVCRGVRQHAIGLRGFLADVYAGRPTVVPADVLASNPYSYVRRDWVAPSPASLAQYLAHVSYDVDRGAFVIVDENADSGRAGLATVQATRLAMSEIHADLLATIGARPPDDLLSAMRECVMSYRPAGVKSPHVVMAVAREQPPFDLPDWEDLLLADGLGFPLVAETDLLADTSGLYQRLSDGRRVRVDIVLHRRPTNSFQHARWGQLVRAGALALVDPISSALTNDRGLAAYTNELVRAYAGEEPLLSAPDATILLDVRQRHDALDEIDRYVWRERGGRFGRRTYPGAQLDSAERAALCAAVESAPERWVAQRRVRTGTTLLFTPSVEGVEVAEAAFRLHAYVLVGHEVVAPCAFAGRVTRNQVGRLQEIAAEVIVYSRDAT